MDLENLVAAALLTPAQLKKFRQDHTIRTIRNGGLDPDETDDG